MEVLRKSGRDAGSTFSCGNYATTFIEDICRWSALPPSDTSAKFKSFVAAEHA
jgi:hypothetical protein